MRPAAAAAWFTRDQCADGRPDPLVTIKRGYDPR
jgi:hypothetical protein